MLFTKTTYMYIPAYWNHVKAKQAHNKIRVVIFLRDYREFSEIFCGQRALFRR